MFCFIKVFPIVVPSFENENNFSRFLLPYDIYYQARLESLLDSCRKMDMERFKYPYPFIHIRKSLYSSEIPKVFDHHAKCRCFYVENVRGCKKKCINRMMRVECTKQTCSLGKYCSNRSISKKKWKKCVVLKAENGKGWGLFVDEPVKKGQLIIEYVGEVIPSSECEYRLQNHYKGERCFYMLTLDANWVIDATRMGSIARFTNHSCDPNCETQKW